MKNLPVKRFASADEGMIGPQRFYDIPRIMFGIPTTGIVRFEWAMQMAQLISPVNWSQSITAVNMPMYGPMGFAVAAARNQCVQHAMEKGLTGERYLLTGENLSWSEVITTLADALNIAPPERTISPGLMHLTAVFFELAARITRQRPLITKEAARLSSSTRCYTNQKAKHELGCTFRPFQETARRIAAES